MFLTSYFPIGVQFPLFSELRRLSLCFADSVLRAFDRRFNLSRSALPGKAFLFVYDSEDGKGPQPPLINLSDFLGMFSSVVTAALRIIDGAVVVVDCI